MPASVTSTFSTPGIRAFGVKNQHTYPGEVVAIGARDEFGAFHFTPCFVELQFKNDDGEAALALFLAVDIIHESGHPDLCELSGHWLLNLHQVRDVYPGFESDVECAEQLDVFGTNWRVAERDYRVCIVDLASEPVRRNMNQAEWYPKVTPRPPAPPVATTPQPYQSCIPLPAGGAHDAKRRGAPGPGHECRGWRPVQNEARECCKEVSHYREVR